MAWMETGYETGQEMRPWISPSLIEANHILSLSQQELQAAIATEMMANPALELDDRPTCPNCGSIIDGDFCPTCLTTTEKERKEERLDSFDDFAEASLTGNGLREDDPDFDPMTLIASGMSLAEQILVDARSILDEGEHEIAEYIVQSFDERGFLTMTVDEIATDLGVDVAMVRAVLEIVQDVAPVGVGARSLQECLQLQVTYLAAIGTPVPGLVSVIIAKYLKEFGGHKFGAIARALGVTVEDVDEARDFIRIHLNPFPLQSGQARSWSSPTEERYVAPDVVIAIKNDELTVEVIDSKYLHLRMNPLYEELAQQFGRKKSRFARETTPPPAPEPEIDTAGVTDDEKAHVRQYTNRARVFMTNVQQRRDTLLRISACIVELQDGFLRGGVRELRPLTRAIVAQQVGVHESTVSRATANKFVMLPSRKVIPFSDFFTPSLSTKDIIKELIERESGKGQMLTDKKICDLLLHQGVRIARRTVAKYRAELGILPSTMR